MNCSEFRELISARLDGELNAEEQATLEAHLESCDSCRDFSSAMEKLRAAGAEDRLSEIPPELERAILKETVKAAPKKRSVFGLLRGYYRIPRGVAWATMVILLLLTANTLRGPSEPKTETAAIAEVEEAAVIIQKIELSEEDIVLTSTRSNAAEEI